MEEIKESTPIFGFLPSDIVHDILVRLPAKSLKRFRCVCKSWRCLISDSEFVKMHMDGASQKFLLSSITSYSIDYHNQYETLPPLPWRDLEREPTILGSCNGLVIMAGDYGECYCWNPSIREFKQLEDISFGKIDNLQLVGFFYDSYADDYKMVVVMYPVFLPQNNSSSSRLLSLKTNTWSNINAFPYEILGNDEKATLVNGLPHWMVRCDTFTSSSSYATTMLMYFDVGNQEFKELPQPFVDEMHVRLELGVLGGCLCSIRIRSDHRDTEIWIMKEYGLKESWTKLFIISRLPQIRYVFDLKPLSFTKNGEILMLINEDKIIVYNHAESKLREILVPDHEESFNVAIYVESLVSPNC